MDKRVFLSAGALAFVLGLGGCKTTEVKKDPFTTLVKEGRIDEAKGRFTFTDDINETDEEGNTALHIAAASNNTDLINFLILKGANSSLKNGESMTPLHVAINNDSREAAEILSKIGTNIFDFSGDGYMALDMGIAKDEIYYDIFINETTGKIKDSEGRTIVHHFTQTKDQKGLEMCHLKGIYISPKDNSNQTPLDMAFAEAENSEAAEIAAILIKAGAEHVDSDFSYFQEALTNRNLNMRFEDGQTPLHIASILGHTGIAKYLLENEAQTNVQDSTGTTPLHEAVRYGNLEIAKMILDAGGNVNAKNNLGKTPILLAVPEIKCSETYRTLLQYRADATVKDMYGDTALHTATMTNVPPTVLQELINGGADINARNKEGVTPLLVALENHNQEHVQFYASHGADINSQDNRGNSPLKVALASKDNIIETIINKYNIDSHDSAGNTPLHVSIIENASLQKIQFILSLMDDVNQRNAEGNNALYLSILKNRQRIGELLLAKNADIFSANNLNYSPLRLALKAGGSVMDWLITPYTVKQKDGSGNTVLHYAAEWEVNDAIEALISKGADSAATNANGETPLFNAVKTNNPDLIELLVKKGCKINHRDNLGGTPLHHAVRWDAPLSAKKLIELKADVNAQNVAGKSPLAEAVLTGKLDTVKLLLSQGADPNSSDTTGRTVLMEAIRGQNPEIVKYLLASRANPNIQETNGRNAYHEAALTANIEIIRIIRNAGGNPLSRDKNGNTPFSLSLPYSEQIVKAVLGSDKTISDSDGNTPVHIIVKNNGTEKQLQFLIDAKYSVDTRNSEGLTPLGLAVEKNNIQLAEMLLANGANPFVSIDKKGNTPCSIALRKADQKMLANIVKYSGTMSDIQGNTILHYAARLSEPKIVKLLLSFGLDPNVKNISGETAYDTAIRWNKKDTAQILGGSDSGESK